MSACDNDLSPEVTENLEEDAFKWQIASSKNQKPLKPKGPKKKKPVQEEPQAPPINDTYNSQNLEIVRRYLKQNEKCMVILRGCPGSGKSTLAKQIKFSGIIVSADTYFIDERGVYIFNPHKLADAHMYCRNKVNEAVKNNISPIIVDNTNLRGWEFKAYATMAFQNNYQVELMEPNTPWRYKPSILASKNTHSVSLGKIQKLLVDFEKNIDVKLLTGLSGACQKPAAKPKPGAFIKNFDQYFAKHDWGPNENDVTNENVSDTNALAGNKEFEGSLFTQHSRTNSASSGKSLYHLSEKSGEAYPVKISYEEANKGKLNESKEILKALFSDVDDDILLDFLVKYDNDVTVVTNILLDSVNLNDYSSDMKTLVADTKDQTSQDTNESTESDSMLLNGFKELEKLENLKTTEECLETIGSSADFSHSLQDSTEYHLDFERKNKNENKVRHSSSVDDYRSKFTDCYSKMRSNNQTSYKPTFIPPSTKSTRYNSANNTVDSNRSSSPVSSVYSIGSAKFSRSDSESYNINDITGFKEVLNEDEEEPILKLDLSHEFLGSLIQLFGDESDEIMLQNNNNRHIEISIKMAFHLYNGWKKTNNSLNFLNTETKPNHSKYQIERDEKLSKELFDEINMRDPIADQPAFLSDKGINSAQSSLRQIMAEEMAEQLKQERMPKKPVATVPVVDFTKVINTCENQPTKFDIKNTNRVNRSAKEGSPGNKIDYYNSNPNDFVSGLDEFQRAEYRHVANKYFNIRADYFRKAGEAFQKRWGGVAQYYAEMGHEQTLNMQQSNEIASIQTFLNNNPGIQKSNTLDLHGLQVKEALQVLKNVMFEKKIELTNVNGKKLKTYLFVITGFGHNSENGPRLRPNIINYLNQTGIRYSEPNIGLLRIDLLNN